MARGKLIAAAAVVVVLLAVAGVYIATTASTYRVNLVMDSAAQLAEGSPVWIDGTQVGKIGSLSVREAKAVAELDLDTPPLHDGTTSRIEWKSALGERVLTLYPGPAQNPEVPDGGSIQGKSLQIEVDQVLAALDAPTRVKLSGMLQQLNGTLKGREPDVKQTLNATGPAVNALGEVLQAVGKDGPALRGLVVQLAEMSRTAAGRQQQVRDVVNGLSGVTDSAATQQQALSEALTELPPTLSAAEDTLDRVPGAVKKTIPLLEDLRPATEKLPSVARNLSPVLQDLRPTVAKLRPTLNALSGLLERAPGLLDKSHGVFPPLQKTVEGYTPAVRFLRPYAPELAGFLTNFGTAFAQKDEQGKFWTGLLAPGANAFNESFLVPPSSRNNPEPVPGQIVGEPYDANGSGIR